jgi:hypothetical protein
MCLRARVCTRRWTNSLCPPAPLVSLQPYRTGHGSKWKGWLFRAGQDPNIDSLALLGNVLEEVMDLPPADPAAVETWREKRGRIDSTLEQNGLRMTAA